MHTKLIITASTLLLVFSMVTSPRAAFAIRNLEDTVAGIWKKSWSRVKRQHNQASSSKLSQIQVFGENDDR
jgi:hypothetical protein